MASVYVFLVGLLLAQYTFTGYDASAHMTEETRGPDVAGPRGIVMSIVVSLVAGWVLLIGVTHAIAPGTTFNYASITTAVVLFGAGGWYLASAKNWFHGPKVQGAPEELAAIEAELKAVGKA